MIVFVIFAYSEFEYKEACDKIIVIVQLGIKIDKYKKNYDIISNMIYRRMQKMKIFREKSRANLPKSENKNTNTIARLIAILN